MDKILTEMPKRARKFHTYHTDGNIVPRDIVDILEVNVLHRVGKNHDFSI